jgi:DeoR family transcriptional regulator, fructose operon transcriptional repressor
MKDLPAAVSARHALIIQWLADEGRLDVLNLAGRLGVAQETIRRDLRSLESGGRLQRVHGGAVPVEANAFPVLPPATEPGSHDLALAERLWDLLPRTGTLLLGAGPLTLALVSVIANDPPPNPGLTIVSNSLDAVIASARIAHLSVYNIGGSVAPATRAQEGDWALQELARLQVDVSLVCPAGLSLERGLGQSTPAAAAVSQAEVACGQNVIVLAGADVLGRAAFVQFATWREIDTVMLAGRPDETVLDPFLDHGVDVQVVEAEDESELLHPPIEGAE